MDYFLEIKFREVLDTHKYAQTLARKGGKKFVVPVSDFCPNGYEFVALQYCECNSARCMYRQKIRSRFLVRQLMRKHLCDTAANGKPLVSLYFVETNQLPYSFNPFQ